MTAGQPNVCVFAPGLLVTVTIESGNGDEMHFHLGGQGFWVARMIREMGERPLLCAPVGGEAGSVIRGLVGSTGLDFSPVHIGAPSAGYVHDRREGERREVAATRSPDLSRHELDDLFGRTLQHALTTGACVLTGRRRGDAVPTEFYRRLAADCLTSDVALIGDLHGEELAAVLDGGGLEVLKVSDEDLVEDGLLPSEPDQDSIWSAIDHLVERGARSVVVSRAELGAMGRRGETRLVALPPELEVVDPAGAGDSMTAGLVVATIRELGFADSLRLACGAGAANVTRHGLGSSPGELIEQLVPLVEVIEVNKSE